MAPPNQDSVCPGAGWGVPLRPRRGTGLCVGVDEEEDGGVDGRVVSGGEPSHRGKAGVTERVLRRSSAVRSAVQDHRGVYDAGAEAGIEPFPIQSGSGVWSHSQKMGNQAERSSWCISMASAVTLPSGRRGIGAVR